MSPVLEGPRVRLRRVTAADLPRLLALVAEPAVRRWWGPYDLPRLRAEILEDPAATTFVIETGGETAGFATYYEENDPYYRYASIDISLATAHQGRGLGPEALRVLAGYLFGERGHHRITIDPATDNGRAIAAYRKVGFRPVGVMRQYELREDGAWHDGLLMDLLRDELTPEP
jgi:aminoglycoside 6'-N-acetyltransferase